MGAAAIFAGATAAGSLAQGVGGYQQGKANSAAAASQARAARIRGMEVEATRRDDLVRSLSAFNAARGANNLSISSPTAVAYANDLRAYARRDYLAERRNIEQQAQSYMSASDTARRGAQFSLLSGAINAGTSLFDYSQAGRAG